jgi:hypothetical protein
MKYKKNLKQKLLLFHQRLESYKRRTGVTSKDYKEYKTDKDNWSSLKTP